MDINSFISKVELVLEKNEIDLLNLKSDLKHIVHHFTSDYPLNFKFPVFKAFALIGILAYRSRSHELQAFFIGSLTSFFSKHLHYQTFIDFNVYKTSSKEDLISFFRLISHITGFTPLNYFNTIIITNERKNSASDYDFINQVLKITERKIRFNLPDLIRILISKNFINLVQTLNVFDKFSGEAFIRHVLKGEDYFGEIHYFRKSFLYDLFYFEELKYSFFTDLIKSGYFDSISEEDYYESYFWFKNPKIDQNPLYIDLKPYALYRAKYDYSLLPTVFAKNLDSVEDFFREEMITPLLLTFDINNPSIQVFSISEKLYSFLESYNNPTTNVLEFTDDSLVSKLTHIGILRLRKEKSS